MKQFENEAFIAGIVLTPKDFEVIASLYSDLKKSHLVHYEEALKQLIPIMNDQKQMY